MFALFLVIYADLLSFLPSRGNRTDKYVLYEYIYLLIRCMRSFWCVKFKICTALNWESFQIKILLLCHNPPDHYNNIRVTFWYSHSHCKVQIYCSGENIIIDNMRIRENYMIIFMDGLCFCFCFILWFS